MCQATASSPVLRGGVGVDDFGQRPLLGETRQHAIGAPGLGIRLWQVAVREEAIGAAAGLAGGLGKAVIELAMLGPGHVGYQAVEHGAPLLVEIEAEVEQVPKKPAALGRAEGIGVLDSLGIRAISAWVALFSGGVTQEGGAVAGSQQA